MKLSTARKLNVPKKSKAKEEVKSVQEDTRQNEIIVPSMTITDNLRAYITEESTDQDVLDAAVQLNSAANQTFITLGGILKYIHENGTYKTLGYEGKEGFKNYAQGELGIDYRRSMYYIKIYEMISEFGIPEDRAASIGWSKLLLLPSYMAEDNVEQLLELAETTSAADLSTSLKNDYETITAVVPRGGRATSRFVFSVAREDAETVNKALELAATKNEVEPENKAQAFLSMSIDYLTLAGKTDSIPLNKIKSYLKKIGYKVVKDVQSESDSSKSPKKSK